jgi:hypothetical protein
MSGCMLSALLCRRMLVVLLLGTHECASCLVRCLVLCACSCVCLRAQEFGMASAGPAVRPTSAFMRSNPQSRRVLSRCFAVVIPAIPVLTLPYLPPGLSPPQIHSLASL